MHFCQTTRPITKFGTLTNNMYGVVKFLTVPSNLSLRSTHYLIP